eukprot:403359065
MSSQQLFQNQFVLKEIYESYFSILENEQFQNQLDFDQFQERNCLCQSQRMDLMMECLVYLSLKADFKKLLLNKYSQTFKSFLLHIAKYKLPKLALLNSSLSQQANLFLMSNPDTLKSSIVFMLLNLLRSQDYDLIPSFTYTKSEKLKDMDMSYYQLKELKQTLKQSKQLYSQLNQEFINEYGEEELVIELRLCLITECEILSVFKGMRDFIRFKSGIITKKMLSESLLHLAGQKELIPLLVSNGIIGYLLEIRKSMREQTSDDFHLAIESEINIAQTLAKIFIFTNPNLIQDHAKMDAVSLLTKTLIIDKCHHELLIFEGLLALTNISSLEEDYREKILQEGGWQNAKNFLFEKNLQIVTASIELMSNLALTSTIQSRLESLKLINDIEIVIQIFVEYADQNQKLVLAVVSLIANVIQIESVKQLIFGYDQEKLPKLMTKIFESCINAQRGDIWHRALYILDELKEDLNYRKLVKVSKNELVQGLHRIRAQSKIQEVHRLAEYFITYFS